MAASASSAMVEHTVDNPVGEAAAHDGGLLLIGLFKLSKAFFLVGVSLGALHFLHHDLSHALEQLFAKLRFDNESRFVGLALGKAELVTHHRIRLFSLGSAGYALLCTVEGTGLILRKTWAEYLTLWLSASFLPWELYELVRHRNFWRLAILLMNFLITMYIVWLLRRRRQQPGAMEG